MNKILTKMLILLVTLAIVLPMPDPVSAQSITTPCLGWANDQGCEISIATEVTPAVSAASAAPPIYVELIVHVYKRDFRLDVLTRSDSSLPDLEVSVVGQKINQLVKASPTNGTVFSAKNAWNMGETLRVKATHGGVTLAEVQLTPLDASPVWASVYQGSDGCQIRGHNDPFLTAEYFTPSTNRLIARQQSEQKAEDWQFALANVASADIHVVASSALKAGQPSGAIRGDYWFRNVTNKCYHTTPPVCNGITTSPSANLPIVAGTTVSVTAAISGDAVSATIVNGAVVVAGPVAVTSGVANFVFKAEPAVSYQVTLVGEDGKATSGCSFGFGHFPVCNGVTADPSQETKIVEGTLVTVTANISGDAATASVVAPDGSVVAGPSHVSKGAAQFRFQAQPNLTYHLLINGAGGTVQGCEFAWGSIAAPSCDAIELSPSSGSAISTDVTAAITATLSGAKSAFVVELPAMTTIAGPLDASNTVHFSIPVKPGIEYAILGKNEAGASNVSACGFRFLPGPVEEEGKVSLYLPIVQTMHVVTVEHESLTGRYVFGRDPQFCPTDASLTKGDLDSSDGVVAPAVVNCAAPQSYDVGQWLMSFQNTKARWAFVSALPGLVVDMLHPKNWNGLQFHTTLAGKHFQVRGLAGQRPNDPAGDVTLVVYDDAGLSRSYSWSELSGVGAVEVDGWQIKAITYVFPGGNAAGFPASAQGIALVSAGLEVWATQVQAWPSSLREGQFDVIIKSTFDRAQLSGLFGCSILSGSVCDPNQFVVDGLFPKAATKAASTPTVVDDVTWNSYLFK